MRRLIRRLMSLVLITFILPAAVYPQGRAEKRHPPAFNRDIRDKVFAFLKADMHSHAFLKSLVLWQRFYYEALFRKRKGFKLHGF